MILVTGANGLLGSKICQELSENGQAVRALVRKDSDLSLLNECKSKIDLVFGDILIPEEIEEKLEDISVIIHCAAIISFHSSEIEIMNKVNVQGTANMVNLATKHGVEYFIQMSSVAAIGRNSDSQILNEESKWEDGSWNSNYGRSKRLAELEVWRSAEEGLNIVILNPSVIISPDDWNRSSGKLFKYVWDENKFYPTGCINYVDIRDVVKSVMLCLEKRVSNQRYILNAGSMPYKEFFDTIALHFGKSAPTVKANVFLIGIARLISWLKFILTGQKPLITKETARTGKSEKIFSSEKIEKDLKFNFEAITETLRWACSSILLRNQ